MWVALAHPRDAGLRADQHERRVQIAIHGAGSAARPSHVQEDSSLGAKVSLLDQSTALRPIDDSLDAADSSPHDGMAWRREGG